MAALGDDFRKARESRSVALADAAQQLHIRLEFLEAIEAERWEAIGDLVSLRGLLRTYARYLGLDGGAMVDRFNRECAPNMPQQPVVTKAKSFDPKAFGAVSLSVIAVVMLFFSLMQFVERTRIRHEVAAEATATPTAKPTPHASVRTPLPVITSGPELSPTPLSTQPTASPVPSPTATQL